MDQWKLLSIVFGGALVILLPTTLVLAYSLWRTRSQYDYDSDQESVSSHEDIVVEIKGPAYEESSAKSTNSAFRGSLHTFSSRRCKSMVDVPANSDCEGSSSPRPASVGSPQVFYSKALSGPPAKRKKNRPPIPLLLFCFAASRKIGS